MPQTIARLEAHFAAAPEVLRGSPASDAAIEQAQHRLECRFHEDYVEFLVLFGCGVIGPYPVFGIGPTPDAMAEGDGVVEQTERFRAQRWPGITS
jgi:hypothetical protein